MTDVSYRRRSPGAGENLVTDVSAIDGVPVVVLRRAGRIVETLRAVEPNHVHAALYDARRNEWADLGLSKNLRTDVGTDWEASILGGQAGTTTGSPATAVSTTSLTATGTPWTANAYAGRRVVAASASGYPVYGNIGSNTSSVLTIDQWWTGADGVGAAPASSAAFAILPGAANARFIGLSTNTTAPAAADLTLVGEISTNGLGRALGTYAHVAGTTSYTLTKTFTYTGGTSVTISKAGAFTAGTATAGGLLVFETLLSVTATVSTSGDQVAFTWTVNY